jgi:MraZ protein
MAINGKPLYTGIFRHSLDDKNRLTIPSSWRSAHAESDQFLILPLDGFLSVVPPDQVAKLYDKAAEVSLSDTEAQGASSDFFGNSLAFTFDKAGRVMLTPALCASAGIGKDVVLAGTLTKFNLYSPEQWARVQAAKAAQKPGDLLRRIGI